MSRLVVNPGTPHAWEIQLRPGANLLGRRSDCDFPINDLSVSGSHCRITVDGESAQLQDLGSTNGTFINGAQVHEASLQTGQTVRLGSVETVFYSEAAVATPSLPVVIPAAPAPRARLRINSAPAAEADTAPALASAAVAEPPTIPEPAGARFCKFHPKSPARYLCRKCNRTFCEMCVSARAVGGVAKKTCRTCGVECVPLEGAVIRPAAARGFFARLPGVFIYPFRGSGVMVLIVATLVFAGLKFISAGIFALLAKAIVLGYLFSFMQAIIHSTAVDDQEMPPLPGMDELFGACFRLLGTVVISFGIPIGLLIARLFDVDIPMSVILVTGVLGSIYFPMAFLAVAMMDSALSANPLVVIPAILKVPVHYLVTAILFASIFGFSQLGNIIISLVGGLTLSTRSSGVFFLSLAMLAAWSFVSVYLLTVNMRILGLLYLTNKSKFGWYKN